MRFRDEVKWTQDDLGARLGVSRRTVSNWENGYWLPPFKQRLHVVLALRDAPPGFVLTIADALGVSVDPAVAPLLQPFRDALDPPAPVAPPLPPPPPEPPRVRPEPAHLRAAVDAVVRDAADAMNVAANELRAAVGRALAACAELGATVEETQAAVAVAVRGGKGKR
jgi:hypothetical protein